MFSLVWNVGLIQIQRNYEKQITIKECHIGERESKRKNLRRLIWLMYSLCKNEYRICKPVETTVRQGTMVERKEIEEVNQLKL
jgi:hypothetical protein